LKTINFLFCFVVFFFINLFICACII
jgi:hypothetical protein